MTWTTSSSNTNSTIFFGNGNAFLSWARPEPVSDDPVLSGDGPPECSSCTELSVLPVNIWDVNGYYRELGVDPKATRKQLMQAYRQKVTEHQIGPQAARLTYVLQQLLNSQVRFIYDCAPLGTMFMDDYVIAEINRRVKAERSQRMTMMAEQGYDLQQVDPDDVEQEIWSEMGLPVTRKTPPGEDLEDTPDEVVDAVEESGEDDDRPAEFEYSFYLWKTRLRDESVGLSRLADWQRLLVSALSREGVSLRFSVGLHGKPHRWIKSRVGYRTVFFLNTDLDPTEEMASLVARQSREDGDHLLANR